MRPTEIEQTKRHYTDRYVSVDSQRPELARFAGLVGRVKTVNMSGRALVEWVDYHQNCGWYDIPVQDLKLVEKPTEPEPAQAIKPPAAAVKKAASGLSPLEQLRQQAAAQKASATPAPQANPAGSGKPSTSDILAQLRASQASQSDASHDQ